MPVSFETIDASIRTPTHHFEVVGRTSSGFNRTRKNVLLCGIKLSTGTVAELIPTRVRSVSEADTFFGVGSQLAEMCRAAIYQRPGINIYACAIDELAGGTAATKTLTIVGTPTASGTYHLRVAGTYIPVAVAASDSVTVQAAAIVTAYNAHAKKPRLPYTATSALGVVTFTMRWKGIDAADIRLNFADGEAIPAGVTSATVAAGVAGAGNPDYSEIVSVLGSTRYHRIAVGVSDDANLDYLETELATRYGGMVQLEGHVFAAYAADLSTTSTYGSGRNSKQSTVIGTNVVMEPPWIWAAQLCAESASQTDPAAPFSQIMLKGLHGPARAAGWDRADRDSLLYEGIATYTSDDSGSVYIERCISTYQTNPLAWKAR